MKVSWQLLDSTHANGDLRGYKVIYKLKKISGRTVAIEETKTVTVHPSLNATRLTGLQPNSQYQIYVVAFNEIGDGVISEGYFGGREFSVLYLLFSPMLREVPKESRNV